MWEIKAGNIEMEFTTCPKPMITPESSWFLRLYRHYKNHLLPHAGGLLDQPNAYLEAMEVIDAAVNRPQ